MTDTEKPHHVDDQDCQPTSHGTSKSSDNEKVDHDNGQDITLALGNPSEQSPNESDDGKKKQKSGGYGYYAVSNGPLKNDQLHSSTACTHQPMDFDIV